MFEKKEIDIAAKDIEHKIFNPDFSISLEITEIDADEKFGLHTPAARETLSTARDEMPVKVTRTRVDDDNAVSIARP